MDISNTRRSVLLVTLVILISLIGILIFTVIMIKNNNLNFQTPVLIRENPTVTYSSGETYYRKKNSDDWLPVEIGLILKENESVKTGIDGFLDIKFSNGTVIRITEDSFLSLDDVSLTTIDLNLSKGGIVSKFTKLFSNQKYTVKTPVAVAGIRGTELIINSDPEGTSIVGMSGITEIFNIDYPENRVLLGFQTKSEILNNQSPSNPVALTQEEVTSYRNMLDSINTDEVLVLGKAVQFKPDTAEIMEESIQELEKLAGKMKWRFFKVEIRGHTADIGDAGSQYSLSLMRAESIKDYLISQKINPRRLSVRAYGGSKPIASNETPEGRAKNRRVEFVIIE